MAIKYQIRRGLAATWTSANPTLLAGEIGYETDTKLIKVGDGSTAWTSLAYATVTPTSSQTLTNKTLSSAVLTGTLTAGGSAGTNGYYLQTTGSGVQWAAVSGYVAPTLGSTTIASGSTVTTIAGLTLSGATLTGTLTANSSTGTSGQILTSTGTGVQWSTPAAGAAFSEFLLIGA